MKNLKQTQMHIKSVSGALNLLIFEARRSEMCKRFIVLLVTLCLVTLVSANMDFVEMLPNPSFENPSLDPGTSTATTYWDAYQKGDINVIYRHPGWGAPQAVDGLNVLEVKGTWDNTPVAHSQVNPSTNPYYGWTNCADGVEAKKYKLSVWIWSEEGQDEPGKELGLELFTGTTGRKEFLPWKDIEGGFQTGQWNYAELIWDNTVNPVAIGEPLAVAFITSTRFGHTAYFDDASLMSIPEPTTIALLSIGGLALIRRKRS